LRFLPSFPTRRSSDLSSIIFFSSSNSYLSKSVSIAKKGEPGWRVVEIFFDYGIYFLGEILALVYQWVVFLGIAIRIKTDRTLFQDRKSTRLNSSHVKT